MFEQQFLRLGVACAIYDDDGRVLLSRRGDLNVWNLPTGRLDSHEDVRRAAAREVFEETGLRVGIERAVGLYYLEATSRLNILFAGYPIGGQIEQSTPEASANRFFWLSSMPEETFGARMAHDAFETGEAVLHTVSTPSDEIRRIRLKLAWRWVMNLLKGHPEPRHVRFNLRAVGVLWDEGHNRVICLPAEDGTTLPRVTLKGSYAPWVALRRRLQGYTSADIPLKWVGLWQDVDENTLEFVFAGVVPPEQGVMPDLRGSAMWIMAQNSSLVGRDADFVDAIGARFYEESVWIQLEEHQPPRQLHR